MGFFDNVKSFFGNVGTFFGNVKDKVVDTVTNVWNKGKEIVSGVVDTGRNVVVTLHQDAQDYARGLKDLAEKGINKGGDVVVHAEDTLGGIAKSFSWPLILVGGAAGLYMLNKK